MTGSIMTLNVSRLASIQRGRSTTRTGAVADVAWRSLNSRTGASDLAAPSRSSATASATSAADRSGPGFDSLVAVESASFQSIMPDATATAWWVIAADYGVDS